MVKKADLLAVAKDRTATILLILLGISGIILIITTVFRLHVSDVQIPVRYTGYGLSNIFRDQWYTHLSYVGFAMIIMGVNGYLSVKLYQLRRVLGLGLMGMSIFLILVAIILGNSIFNLSPTV